MGANAQKPKVTMRHPHEDIENDLECFEFQVEHWKSLGWERVADEDDAPKPAPAKKVAAPAVVAPKPETKEG